MSKDERLIDNAISYAIEAMREKRDQLEEILSEFDIPEPNEIQDGIWNLNHEIGELEAISRRRYHAKLAELLKGSD